MNNNRAMLVFGHIQAQDLETGETWGIQAGTIFRLISGKIKDMPHGKCYHVAVGPCQFFIPVDRLALIGPSAQNPKGN